MRLRVKLISVLLTFVLAFFAILLIVWFQQLKGVQGEARADFRAEILELGIELSDSNANRFFESYTAYSAEFPDASIDQIFRNLRSDTGYTFAYTFEGDIQKFEDVPGPLLQLASLDTLESAIDRAQTVNQLDFLLDNYNVFRSGNNQDVPPIRAHYRVDLENRRIIAHGQALYSVLARLRNQEERSRNATLEYAVSGIVVSLAGLVALLLIMILVARRLITHPVHQLVASIKDYQSGNTNQNIAPPTGDEFQTIGEAIDNLNLERSRAESDRERLASAVEQAGESIVISDANAIIQYVNPAFADITGYSRKDVIGNDMFFLRNGHGQHENLNRSIWQTLHQNEVWMGELANKKKDGTLYTEKASISPVFDEAGNTVNYVTVARDITEELQLQDQLRQSQKMDAIGQLAGGFAHDFRNMLGGIIGSAQLLSMRMMDEKHKKFVDIIMNSATNASDLTTKMLSFSRKQRAEMKPTDIAESIKDAINLLEHSIDKRILIETDLSVDAPIVVGNNAELQNVFMNLSLNAQDAMPDGGTLRFVMEEALLTEEECKKSRFEIKPGRYLLVTVSDTGTGMNEEALQRAFDPFYTTKDVGKGTGLGLSVVYGTVQAMNGAIEVSSEIGVGTSFKLFFPMKGGNVSSAKDKAIIKGSGTVLLIDDEEGMRLMAEAALTELGYEVLTAVDGLDGLKQYKDNIDRIDFVVTDLTMPEMNGRDTFFEMQKINPGVKVILASGYIERDEFDELKQKGLCALINKPYEIHQFSKVLHEISEN